MTLLFMPVGGVSIEPKKTQAVSFIFGCCANDTAADFFSLTLAAAYLLILHKNAHIFSELYIYMNYGKM